MKPTKMRNRQIYQASNAVRSRQVSSTLTKKLRTEFGKRCIRIREGDNVTILRGEFKNVSGKISSVFIYKGVVTIEGIKKEKADGQKYDVKIHASNLRVTGLNLDDSWRKSKKKQREKAVIQSDDKSKTVVVETNKPETDVEEVIPRVSLGGVEREDEVVEDEEGVVKEDVDVDYVEEDVEMDDDIEVVKEEGVVDELSAGILSDDIEVVKEEGVVDELSAGILSDDIEVVKEEGVVDEVFGGVVEDDDIEVVKDDVDDKDEDVREENENTKDTVTQKQADKTKDEGA